MAVCLPTKLRLFFSSWVLVALAVSDAALCPRDSPDRSYRPVSNRSLGMPRARPASSQPCCIEAPGSDAGVIVLGIGPCRWAGWSGASSMICHADSSAAGPSRLLDRLCRCAASLSDCWSASSGRRGATSLFSALRCLCWRSSFLGVSGAGAVAYSPSGGCPVVLRDGGSRLPRVNAFTVATFCAGTQGRYLPVDQDVNPEPANPRPQWREPSEASGRT